MNKFTRTGRLIGGFLTAVGLACVARAGSYSPPNGIVTNQQLDWDLTLGAGQSIEVKKFDPTKGTLTSVQMEVVQFSGSSVNQFENLTPFSGVAMITNHVDVNVYLKPKNSGDPLGASLLFIEATTVGFQQAFGPQDSNTYDYAGTGGFTVNSTFSQTAFPPPVIYSLDGTGHNLDAYIATVPDETIKFLAGSSSMVTQIVPSNSRTMYDAYATLEIKITYTYTPPPALPGLSIVKSTPKSTALPFEPVTYTYVVKNTGGVPLYDIVVKDDNGTPDYAPDDFTVDVIPELLPGETNVSRGRTSTKTVIPPVCFVGKLCGCGATVPAGLLIPEILSNGDVRATYIQDFAINDNTYGTGGVGWSRGAPGSHNFGNLTGSDKMEFRFFSKASSKVPVIDLYMDCISALNSVTIPGTGQTITYPSGYGTAGPFGGNEGKMVSGDPNNVVTFYTSISDNLNIPANLPKKAELIVNSPTYVAVAKDPAKPFYDLPGVDLTKAPGGWNPYNIYSVTVKAATFGTAGFGSVSIPDQHNSPTKQGCYQLPNTPTCWAVNNTATANGAVTVGGALTVSATPATAHVDVCPAVGTPPCTSSWTHEDVGIPAESGSHECSIERSWTHEDVGIPAVACSASVTGSVFTVKGSGTDIGGGEDKFNFYHTDASGDCTIVARVVSVQNVDKDSRAGVMIRASTDKKSKFEGIFVTPSSGLVMVQRDCGGDLRKPGIVAPYWVKIVRVGNNFTTSYSADGSVWTTLGVKTISMPTDLLIGLAVCSHKNDTLCTAVFDNLTVIP